MFIYNIWRADQISFCSKWNLPKGIVPLCGSGHIGDMPSSHCSFPFCGMWICGLLYFSLFWLFIKWLNICFSRSIRTGYGWFWSFTNLKAIEISSQQKLCRWACKLWCSDGGKFLLSSVWILNVMLSHSMVLDPLMCFFMGFLLSTFCMKEISEP